MKSREVWKGLEELQQAKLHTKGLAKSLKFLRVVPLLKSPKVMGLMGIHDPDALHHFNGMNHCPWCGKEGQNEGTIINHLRMVHYRLGLMCEKCHNYPSTSSDTLCHHGQQNCQPSGEGGPNEGWLIRITASRKCTGLISSNWESEQRSQEGFGFPSGCLIRNTPYPLAWPWRRTRWRWHHLPTHKSNHLFSHTSRSGGCLPIQNCTRHLPMILDFINLRLKVNNIKS